MTSLFESLTDLNTNYKESKEFIVACSIIFKTINI